MTVAGVLHSGWTWLAFGIFVLLWLLSDINVNATITEDLPTLTHLGQGATIP